MFEGSYPLVLDVKGRLTIPMELRADLEQQCANKLTITRHFGPYLRMYPRPEWERARDYMVANFTMKQDSARRLVIGSADGVEMDGNGRVLISQILRKAAKLDRKVVLVGDVNRFEIWDEELHARHLDQLVEAGLPEDLYDVPGL